MLNAVSYFYNRQIISGNFFKTENHPIVEGSLASFYGHEEHRQMHDAITRESSQFCQNLRACLML